MHTPHAPTRRDLLACAAAMLLAPSRSPAQDAPPLSPLLIDQAGDPIATIEAWRNRREQLRGQWLDFLKPPPRPAAAPDFRILEEDRDAGVIRQKIRYENSPGEILEAYLLKPLKIDGKIPGALSVHSTNEDTIRQGAGLGSQPEKAFGLKLAQQGCIALCPANFLWTGGRNARGKYDYKARTEQVLKQIAPSTGMAKMLFDCRRALDLLLTIPGVDSSRIGVVGHSLGAKEALYLPAFDDRVTVAVSSEGGVGLRLSNWNAAWYLGPAIDSPDFNLEHHQLLAMIAPRPFLLLGGDSADGDKSRPFIDAARSVYELHGKGGQIEFFNHHKGHAVPPEAEEKIYGWFKKYLAL